MSYMMNVLSDLGVDFDFTKTEYKYYKFQSQGFMDLIVETWKVGEWLHVTVAHYYVQEGDLTIDPEIEFRAINLKDISGRAEWDVQPIYFRQDGLDVYQEAIHFGQDRQILLNPELQREIKNFLEFWAKDIKYRGYTLEH